jgi:hypothetical protein
MLWGFRIVALFSSLFFLGSGNRANAFPSLARTAKSEENLCLRCHGNLPALSPISTGVGEPLAPILPMRYQMDWVMHEVQSEDRPPFFDLEGSPGRSTAVLPGRTFYDWTQHKMVEVYLDRCINIFPSGNDFACKFISSGNTTYLVKYPRGNLRRADSCCRWSDGDFYAPRPDVLRNFQRQNQSTHDGRTTNWWVLEEPMPGPFGYGLDSPTNEPLTFWFPVIGAWAQQNFSNFSTAPPDPEVFAIPELCASKVPVCE